MNSMFDVVYTVKTTTFSNTPGHSGLLQRLLVMFVYLTHCEAKANRLTNRALSASLELANIHPTGMEGSPDWEVGLGKLSPVSLSDVPTELCHVAWFSSPA